MADISDVVTTLGRLIEGIVYPSGPTTAPIAGYVVTTVGGWPDPKTLDASLAAGCTTISIWPLPMERITSVAMGDMEWEEAENDGVDGVVVQSVTRQDRRFQITIWANDPAVRDALAKAVDPALRAIPHLTLSDGSPAILRYAGQTQIDQRQTQNIYRRDLFYTVEYSTILSQDAFTVLHGLTNLTTGSLVGDMTPTTITR